MSKYSRESIRHITSWWIFYHEDRLHVGRVMPDLLATLIEEAEDDPEGCDRKLSEAYEEYVPAECVR